jgi:hypothetical protein
MVTTGKTHTRPHDRQRPKMPKVGRVTLAGAGPGWSLWWPVELWQSMTEDERAAVAQRQAALLAVSTIVDK